MDPTKSFDPYEIIGIITLGTLVTLLLAAEPPLFQSLLGSRGPTQGDFGLFVLLALVFGHLIQALGNLIEAVVWPRSGLPTDTVRGDTQALISPAQRTRLVERMTAMEGQPVDLATVAPAAWRAMTARAYARASAAGRSGRIDISHRTYDLCRGLVAATTLMLGWRLCARHDQPVLLVILALMAIAAVMRMRRAGNHYARCCKPSLTSTPARSPLPPLSHPNIGNRRRGAVLERCRPLAVRPQSLSVSADEARLPVWPQFSRIQASRCLDLGLIAQSRTGSL